MKLFFRYALQLYLLLHMLHGQAQDPHVSQFMETPLLRNPALAGIFTGNSRVQGLYRNQWRATGIPFRTAILGGEYKMPVGKSDDFLTIGANFLYDETGASLLRQTQAMPVVNFHKSLNANRNSYLSLGVMFGVGTWNLNTRNMSFDNQFIGGTFDPSAPTGERSAVVGRTFADMAIGLSYNGELGGFGNYFMGASYWHFTHKKVNPNDPADFMDPKLQLNGGIKASLSEIVQIHVEGNYFQQGSQSETMIGGLLYHPLGNDGNLPGYAMTVGAGAMYRLGDAIIPTGKLIYGPYELAFSYDINNSPLRTASQSRGGFEVSLTFKGQPGPNAAILLRQRCPSF
jgi:type IX secretion system PorP/SprF family membrane protein